MKRLLCLLLCVALLCGLWGCSAPDRAQLDLYRGYGDRLKLIHLNANTAEKEARIRAFRRVLEDPVLLEKDFSQYAWYPDYFLKVYLEDESQQTLAAYVDLNGSYVDLYFPDRGKIIYRSSVSSQEFQALVHRV